MQKGDFGTAGAHARFLINQANPFGLQFCQGLFNIGNPKGHMLDALAASGNADSKQFYFDLSAILRRYIERRYEIPASEMTTEELLPRVNRLPLKAELAQLLKAFCRGADPIKFAGVCAEQNRMAQDLSFARDFVRQTTEMLNAGDEKGNQARPPAALQKTAVKQIPPDSTNG